MSNIIIFIRLKDLPTYNSLTYDYSNNTNTHSPTQAGLV